MNIKRLKILNLYGKTYDIKFHEKLTILYGLNGSGKTSVLDIIFYILSGNIKRLLKYKFSLLDLEFEHNKKLTRLTIEDRGEYIHGKIDDFEFEIFKEQQQQVRFSEEYKTYSNKTSINNFKEKIVSLSETVYIPLNRRVRLNVPKHIVPVPISYRKRAINEYKNNDEIDSVYYAIPSENQKNIADSIMAANRHFDLHKQRIVRGENTINTRLRNKMVENFSAPITTDLMNADDYDFSNLQEKINEIFNGKKKFKTNINELLSQYNNSRNSYEKKENNIVIKDDKLFIEHISAFVQLSKLNEIEVIASRQKNKIDTLKKNLEHVLYSINYFLKDTYKKIRFNEEENKLVFLNYDNPNEELDLTLLSSGEKQIVIFFVFSLTSQFRTKDKVLLIDEPELSLHIEWQSKLLDLLMENNNSSQIIIATHSPDVIGEYNKYCSEVRGVIN
ncbi:AAA family ATPase [Bacillus haynesii]|uniref:AAA family ATPase n=1 Tax=Bacillus haynesii TaxID=1925021 RepID=UPI00227EE4F7|nr:AAA family ATPase [Bacillus haynesii]MCY8010341.1 AAA family ATPase [Bacillus haynesii]MCY9217335.1 AAA family ATPase [Bacillus haynesii]